MATTQAEPTEECERPVQYGGFTQPPHILASLRQPDTYSVEVQEEDGQTRTVASGTLGFTKPGDKVVANAKMTHPATQTEPGQMEIGFRIESE